MFQFWLHDICSASGLLPERVWWSEGRVCSGMWEVAARFHDSAFCPAKAVTNKQLLPLCVRSLPYSLGSTKWDMLISQAGPFEDSKSRTTIVLFSPSPRPALPGTMGWGCFPQPLALFLCLWLTALCANGPPADALMRRSLRLACVKFGCYLLGYR